MLNKIFSWMKNNKLATVLLVIVGFYVLNGLLTHSMSSATLSTGKRVTGGISATDMMPVYEEAYTEDMEMLAPGMQPMPNKYIPPSTASQRKVVTKSYFSLLVKEVVETSDKIKRQVESLGGYMVQTNIRRPEDGDYASLQVRIPVDTVDTFQAYLRGVAVKVVDENVSGTDITDQYTDVQERITKLETVKRRLEEIMQKAEDVDEILRVQQRIFSIQDQIDSYKGQMKYMDGTTSTTLISIDLSTDELALPYAPVNAWRPGVIFKTSVRSLLGTLQKLGGMAIWLTVYSVIIVPAVGIFIVVKRYIKKRKQSSGTSGIV
jgi:hypothetical protein